MLISEFHFAMHREASCTALIDIGYTVIVIVASSILLPMPSVFKTQVPKALKLLYTVG